MSFSENKQNLIKSKSAHLVKACTIWILKQDPVKGARDANVIINIYLILTH